MSSAEGDSISSFDAGLVSDLAVEPSYISEIARKLQKGQYPMGIRPGEEEEVDGEFTRWGDVSENTAVRKVAKIAFGLVEQHPEQYEMVRVEYDGDEATTMGESQSMGSTHLSFSEIGYEKEKEWRKYAILTNLETEIEDIGTSLEENGLGHLSEVMSAHVKEDVGVEDKVDIINVLSRSGNDMSKYVEEIMQDALERQFRHYDVKESSGYNSPGPDFRVRDTDRRDYGLVVEVSTRWVNEIGEPYIDEKVDEALELETEDVESQPWDVVILAPDFTDSSIKKYEYNGEAAWHADPDEGMVHLHKVPSDNPTLSRPFVTDPDDIQSGKKDGTPIVVPDSEDLRSHVLDVGHVGDDYPVVDGGYEDYVEYMDMVLRDYAVYTESQYRNMVRESLEPLFWEFMRPYQIEQFIIDMYWDKELTQSDIGGLVDRSGSTIGSWMRKWNIIRRGTGAPGLSEEVREIWRRMYEGQSPFPESFSGYRIQAEYNRRPLWDLQDWSEWYEDTTEDERQDVMASRDSFRDGLDYTVMLGAQDRLLPSYTFIISTLKDMDVEIRPPDEAPRGSYNAYPTRDAIQYMLNKDQDTIVDVSGGEG